MEWHLTKNELPKENIYVLIHIPNQPWYAGTSTVFYDVAKVVKGLSEEERKKLDDSNPRKRTYCFGDVFGNNLVPYQWHTFGPDTYFGQEVVAWAYIDEFKMEKINNVNPSKALEYLKKITNYAKSDLDSIPQSFYDLCAKKNKEIDNIAETIKQALLKAQELKNENSGLLEENKNLYTELAFGEKQYKELTEYAIQYKKVLEIIFEKEVSIFQLKSCKNVNEYNDLKFKEENKLTQEEFDLVKRCSNEITRVKD